jgi:hypothetical protein
VDRLRKSPIIQQQQLTLRQTTTFNFTNGEIAAAFSGYDPIQFQAQLPLLRQFLLQDAMNFGSICNIVYPKCNRDELRAWVAKARKRWYELLDELPSAVDQHLHGVSTSVDDALNKLFYGYGGLFHVDINAPDEKESVAAIEGALLHKAFPYLFWCLNVMDSVINWWLDAPNDAVPPLT